MLTFIYDLKFNIVGSVYALFGVVVTSFYQVVIYLAARTFATRNRLKSFLDDWRKTKRIATEFDAASILPGSHFGRSTHFARSHLRAHLSSHLSDMDFLRIGSIFIVQFYSFFNEFVYFQLPVVCSCLIAFTVNLSIYWIIGNTSALT